MSLATHLAWYIYAVLPAFTAVPDIPALLPETQVRALPVGQFTVLASQVPRALFDRHDTAHRTADPDWLAACVQAHHRVNEAASLVAPCLPMAFATLFSDIGLLEVFLAERTVPLSQALAALEGQAEWRLTLVEDVNAHADWLERTEPSLGQIAHDAARAGDGARFLMSKRLEKARATARTRHLQRVATDVRATLSLGEAKDPAWSVWTENLPTGLPGWTILAPRRASLPELLAPNDAALSGAGLSLRLTGPWPAYSFARAALAAGAETERAHG